MSSLFRTTTLAAVLIALPAFAVECRFIGGPQFGGIEPPLVIDAACTDPDYNEKTFVIDSTQQLTLKLPDGSTISYTEVKGHFPATSTQAELPPGILQSPTTVSHTVSPGGFPIRHIGATASFSSLIRWDRIS